MHQARFLLPQRFNLGKLLLYYFREIIAMLIFDFKLHHNYTKDKKEEILRDFDFFSKICVRD